jgi:cohesin complex subunit SA-1/2
VQTVIQDLREKGTAYPLLETAKGPMKDFRSKFSQIWRQLLDACKSGEGHDLVVLKAVIEILKALCNASLVSIRHTATFAGLQIGSFLVKAVLGLARAQEVANRQLDAEESKGGTKGRKAQTLNQRIEQLAGQIRDLEELLEEIFNGIFAHRYRDVQERVRVDCLVALGYFLSAYPSMFLKDQFVKYVGWLLYDTVGRPTRPPPAGHALKGTGVSGRLLVATAGRCRWCA